MIPASPPAFLLGRSKRFRQLCAVSLLFSVLLLFVLLAVAPITQSILHNKVEIDRYALLVPRALHAVENLKTDMGAWSKYENEITENAFLLTGLQQAVAVSQFEAHMRNLSQINDITLVRVLPTAPYSLDDLSLLPFSVEAEGRPADLAAFIHALENSSPLARFDRVEFLIPAENAQTATLKLEVHAFFKASEAG